MIRLKIILSLFFVFYFKSVKSQETKTKWNWKPNKIGFLYNYATEDNFLFDDKDYSYETQTYKLQAFYKLANWRGLDFELIVQPQIQFIKHQLLNVQFVRPEEEDYLNKRDEFSQLKDMNLYSLEFGFAAKKKIMAKLAAQATISLGFSYINTRTERVAKGFTFIENFSLGLSYEAFKDSYLYLGSNLGHVSNLNFSSPNSGYNILGFEIGYAFKI